MNVRTVRMALAAIGGPVLLAGISVLVARSWLPQLPDPVATHWGPRGVDGFTAAGPATWQAGAFSAGFGLLLGVLLWVASSKVPYLRRGAGGLACGMAGFIAFIGVGSLWMQRGLTDARLAPDIGWVIGVGLLVGIGCGALGAWLAPGQVPGAAETHAAVPAGAPRLPLAPGEAAVWVGWAASRTLVLIVGGSTVAAVVLLLAVGAGVVPVLFLTVTLVALLVTMGAFRVVVGADGLSVRSVAGWPRFRVPLSEVAQAGVIEVRALAEYGGWGLRAGRAGRFGVIMRSGEALEVARGDGSAFVVTVDGAGEAAALLNTLAERARASVG